MAPPALTVFFVLLGLVSGSFSLRRPHHDFNLKHKLHRPPRNLNLQSLRKDLLDKCEEKWRNATLDHFSRWKTEDDVASFPQRYFLCSTYWKPDKNGNPGPIFFYLGNEADVLLYLNNTGLMWESAPDFGALLVFAEHRYYGKSLPYGKAVRKHMGYLSTEQAMADYAELIDELKYELKAENSPVIGFGGSYGGMLASWMRMKYPHILDGAIAGSAPIWNFFGEVPPFDPGSFAKGVTYDATEMAGSAPACADNVRAGWKLIEDLGASAQGLRTLKQAANLCSDVPMDDLDDALALRQWLASAWDDMAMGNFPYPSSYILNGHGELPAFPVRVACEYLSEPKLTAEELIQAMAQASGVFYNHSGDVSCFDFREAVNPDSSQVADFWDYQWCTEMFMPFSMDGVDDMFWDSLFNEAESVKACQRQWGVTPRKYWANTEWGGRRIQAASNIVFSNGLLDPWHGGGVLQDVSDSLVAVVIPEGAHHLDLMFSHPNDPMSVTEVRNFQRKKIAEWIEQARQYAPSVMQHIHKHSMEPKGQRHTAIKEATTLSNNQDNRPAGNLAGKAASAWRKLWLSQK